MSGTMTVKELITELLDYGMDEPVYIGLGQRGIPDGSSNIQKVAEFDSNITCGFGVYLIPSEHLEDNDLAPNVEVRGSRSAKHGGDQQAQLVGCPARL